VSHAMLNESSSFFYFNLTNCNTQHTHVQQRNLTEITAVRHNRHELMSVQVQHKHITKYRY